MEIYNNDPVANRCIRCLAIGSVLDEDSSVTQSELAGSLKMLRHSRLLPCHALRNVYIQWAYLKGKQIGSHMNVECPKNNM